MTPLEALMQAALAAPVDRQEAALRVLLGQADATDPSMLTVRHERYLTLVELSRAVGFSCPSLWRFAVPGHDLGGRKRYRVSEVEAYLRSDAFQRRQAALRAERAEYRATRIEPSADQSRPDTERPVKVQEGRGGRKAA